MADKDFEIIVRYSSWDVEVYDNSSNPLIKLNCKSNSWYSKYISGTAKIKGYVFSILDNNEGISLLLNNLQIGHVTIATKDLFGRLATIEIEGEKFFFERKNLKQRFTVTAKNDNILFSIDGKTYKDKQRNLFGLLFFDDKLYHSVFLSNPSTNKTMLQYLLTICGYCIRIFLQIDFGNYDGNVLNEIQTSR